MAKSTGNSNQSGSKGTGSGKGSSTNPQYPSTTGKPSGGGRGNAPKGK